MWETILSWVAIACVLAAVLFGRRASRNKANRLRAEGGAAALAAHLSQSVTVNTDARTAVSGGHSAAYDDGAGVDSAAIERAVSILSARILGGGYGGVGLPTGDRRPALRSVAALGGGVHAGGPEMMSDEALRVLRSNELEAELDEIDAGWSVYDDGKPEALG